MGVTDEALARRLAGAMERKYTQLTDGLRPQELPGVGNRTVARTGEIFLEAGEAPAFKLGYRVEVLHHLLPATVLGLARPRVADGRGA